MNEWIEKFKTIREGELEDIKVELSSLKLSDTDKDATYRKVKDILLRLGNIIVSGVTIQKGAVIARSRCSQNAFFNKQSEISYVTDVGNIKEFNRASPPNIQMFYGAIQSHKINTYELLEAVCLIETSSIIFDENSPAYSTERIDNEYVTTGLWEVIEPLDLAAIVHYDEYCEINNEVLELRSSLIGMIDTVGKYVNKDVLIKILEFIANEFAKPVLPSERYNYMISSGFSEMVLYFGLDGILYPTQKGKGEGFNVALSKKVVDDKLRLKYAMASHLNVQGKKVHPKRLLTSERIENDLIFWEEVPPKAKTDNIHFKHLLK